ncbi:hypothetical protein [Mucilaginibacter robiniae]|nr:hypothetical protein [Mucilaginibacter robiniae]
MDWISGVDIIVTASEVLIALIFDHPTHTKKPQRYSKVEIRLLQIAGGIEYTKLKAKPTFYHGHMTDPDFRLKHGID